MTGTRTKPRKHERHETLKRIHFVFFVCFVLSWLSFTPLVAAVDAPLANAVQHMDRDAVRHLLERRIDVNAPQADGTTALHWAAYNDDLETVKLLLAAGANVKAATREGAITPLFLACINGDAVNNIAASGFLHASGAHLARRMQFGLRFQF